MVCTDLIRLASNFVPFRGARLVPKIFSAASMSKMVTGNSYKVAMHHICKAPSGGILHHIFHYLFHFHSFYLAPGVALIFSLAVTRSVDLFLVKWK